MIRNYLLVAWRNLLKNKFYSIINILGLTVGLAMGILIILWVQDELGFDNFNKQARNIYRLETVGGLGSSRRTFTVSMAPIATFAKKELPEVKNAVRLIHTYRSSSFRYGNNVYKADEMAFTDPSLFSIFNFRIIQGNQSAPFTDKNSIIITKSVAQRYFGSDNPIGKVLVDNNKLSYTVSAVAEDFPLNSSITYGMLIPMERYNQETYVQQNVNYREGSRLGSMDEDWHVLGFETYLLMQPGISVETIQNKLRDIHIRNKPDDTDVAYLMEPLLRMHLYKSDGSDGGIETVKIFSLIAALILLIACINYVNLSTALSMLRSKEVSMRKIIGAGKGQLFMQFVVETAVLFLISTLLAVMAIYFMMPAYNRFSGKELVFLISNYRVWITVSITLLITLAASSIYPALLLSKFEPLKALNGKMLAGMGNLNFRRVLVVTQFFVSVVLIIGTLIISKQMSYIQNKKLGYDKSQVFEFDMRDLDNHFEAVKSELLRSPSIEGVTNAGNDIVDFGGFTGDIEWEGMPQNTNLYIHPISADKDFIPFFKMQLAGGENFTGIASDSNRFILNETAIREMGMKNPIGKKFRLGKTTGTIAGVVEDFHFTSMRKKIEPVIITYAPSQRGVVYVRTTAGNPAAAIAACEKLWKQYNDKNTFNYSFLDEKFSLLYRSEQQTASLFNLFSGVAILISCLGLFGLATYTAKVKTREIGIRKVLGASVPGIIALLAKDFMVLIAVAVLLAVPVALYAMNNWLQNFAYKTTIGIWVFVFAGGAAAVIALLTISVQSVRAALMNPIKSLRSE